MHSFFFFMSTTLLLASIILLFTRILERTWNKIAERIESITEIMLALFVLIGVLTFFSAEKMLASANYWRVRYWTHDIKTDDVISFPYASPGKIAFLKVSGSNEDGSTYMGIWTVADVHGGQCSQTEPVGQPGGVIYGPRNPGNIYVIGRATRPDHRYLLESRTSGCIIDYLVSEHDLADVKQVSKHYGALLASRRKPLPSGAVILERNSVQPLR